MKHILCLGLAPAFQRTLESAAFKMGGVNRMAANHTSPAGKSVNTGIALRRLGQNPLVTAFNGGPTGRLLAARLNELGVPAAFTRVAGETRTCTTIVERDTGVVTELVEEAKRASEQEVAAFIKRNLACLRDCSMLAISGTLPPWVADDFYAPFAFAAAKRNIPWVIDSHGRGLLAVLAMRPFIAKCNRDELRKTALGKSDDFLANAREVMRLGAQNLLVTDGPNPGALVTPEGAWEFDIPEVKVINPIGSGDCVTAGMIAGICEGLSLKDAARLGFGCGSANAMTMLPAWFDHAEACKLAKRVKARPLVA